VGQLYSTFFLVFRFENFYIMSDFVLPVFIKSKDVPRSGDRRPTVLEVCLAAERTSGSGSVLGAQEIHGLWRIYPATKAARTQLLIEGVTLRQTSLSLFDNNPFILKDSSGEEKPSTKLWIDDIPISSADSEIELALKKMGCELRSEIKQERARDADNKLTRFLTGRRFVFITTPPTPLIKTVKINIFSARLFHKEQKMEKKTPICSNCLEEGHHKSACKKDVVCQTCRKKGDKNCSLSATKDADQIVQASTSQETQQPFMKKPVSTALKTQNRGRPTDRGQSTLDATFSRSRSETPKRRHSSDKSDDRLPEKLAKRLTELADENRVSEAGDVSEES